MRRIWKIGLGVAGALILLPAIVLAPPTTELIINLTCRSAPLTPNCLIRTRAMGHVWAQLGWIDRAIHWYDRAATQGDDPASYFHLGWAYEQRGQREAMPRMEAYRKAQDEAAERAAVKYKADLAAGKAVPPDGPEVGNIPEPNVREDFDLAIAAYRKAADHGFAPAMNNIGQMYLSGMFGSRFFADGVLWVTRAAKAGNPLGAINLAFAYTDGRGVPRDTDEAARWGQWTADKTNPRDLARPTLERTAIIFRGDIDAHLAAQIRDKAKTGEAMTSKFTPLQPNPHLPTFSQITKKLRD